MAGRLPLYSFCLCLLLLLPTLSTTASTGSEGQHESNATKPSTGNTTAEAGRELTAEEVKFLMQPGYERVRDKDWVKLYNTSRDLDLNAILSRHVYIIAVVAPQRDCPHCMNVTSALNMVCAPAASIEKDSPFSAKLEKMLDKLPGLPKCAVSDLRGIRRLAPELIIGKPRGGVDYLASKVVLPKILIVDDWTRVPKRPSFTLGRLRKSPEEIALNLTQALLTALVDNPIDEQGYYMKTEDPDSVDMFGDQTYMYGVTKDMAKEMESGWRKDREATARVWSEGVVGETDPVDEEDEAVENAVEEAKRKLREAKKRKRKGKGGKRKGDGKGKTSKKRERAVES
eukprot:CAMPEP_0113893346 /NCGR_PEP_ID=MMETSP0780_2-20120614/16029_1 /TAXON_ID=652834 /ORGANISM="Palpitomonas bilix" /LENGTH=341 /DNA_ID=CAMNT_0000883601 /DNA_START=59 /DNA_END=1084 /DNA_ORIENTATION=- /assembly_acc=CAM_ASM_000599